MSIFGSVLNVRVPSFMCMVGKTDDADADMMPLELYHLLAYEFLKREKFMSWAWLTTAWNHVCRHDNVESLAFHMFNISQDAIRT